MVEVDATLCPICDEACTCPKTSLLVQVKGSSSSATSSSASKKPSAASKKSRPQSKRPAPAPIASSSDDNASNDEDSSSAEADPALSFIKMIYSDEESLDEEEAYALYQATQLFSSSSEDEEFFYYQQQQQKFLESYQQEDDESEGDAENGSEEENEDDESCSEDEEDDDFAYTVVEYVNPIRPGLKKPSSSEPGQSTNEPTEATKEDAHNAANSNNASDWTTWSVFDATDDSEIITIQTSLSPSVLSSTGSGTPETLLFSTSSADKIPNIAPQVLAAISAAAKSMAAGGTGQAATKYFSYITTVAGADSADGEAGEGEFLFFEEEDDAEEAEDEEEEIEEEDDESDQEAVNISLSDYDSLSDDCSVSSADSFERDTFTSSMNRWNRVPIGTFRRSRRLSVPRAIHPSLAMKAAVDPSAVTLTTALLLSAEAGAALDHPCELQRAYSVITLDELNIDISKSDASSSTAQPNCTQSNCFQCSSPVWPAPKRSKSVIPTNSSTMTPEWSNWHWEI